MSVPTDTIQSQPNERNTMPKYDVLATNHVYYSITVEADSVESANLIAADSPISNWSSDDEDFEIHFDNTELTN